MTDPADIPAPALSDEGIAAYAVAIRDLRRAAEDLAGILLPAGVGYTDVRRLAADIAVAGAHDALRRPP